MVEEKILVFNPAGFIAKMIVSIVLTVFLTNNRWQTLEGGLFHMIVDTVGIFAVMYSVASLFGFILNLTRKYIFGTIVFIAVLGLGSMGYGKLMEFVDSHGLVAEIIYSIVFIAVLAAVLICDIRKAILYFKHTV